MSIKTLEKRITKLEKFLMNEGFDISADVFNWFNKYCVDILNSDDKFGVDDLKYNLNTVDLSELVDDCMDDLAIQYGWPPDDMSDYRYQVEYDLEKLVDDALNYIEYGDNDLKFNKNLGDWVDRYKDNVEYTASLESRISNLERRINENVALNQFDCGLLSSEIMKNLKDLKDCDIDLADDNAEYGFVSVGMYNPKYVTDYNITADEYNKFSVENNDKSVGECESFDEIGKLIADHFKKNYLKD